MNKKDQEKKKIAREIFEKLKNKTYEVKKLVTENKELYGSVKPTEISKILKESENIDISSSLIQPVNEIKTVGELDLIVKSAIKSSEKTILIAIYNNQNQRRYIGVKLN